ncbi:DUF1295 domain-containing protein [Amorphus orientalis]|uniref:Steroid 5-alpha reductase family enzyme n=1 Tax=Amorphus orientalis TaxID=649198 RepID=A0AAE3VQD6_9HYPH|nr:DUF1295 domain-containing protein [Amorphus orientalis]MDQ0316053.1 steroid 5-alpha reductase family enzyme [Amorphus orientalis]
MAASQPLALAVTFLITLLMFTLMWRIHVGKEDAGVVDYYWGSGFAVIAFAELALAGAASPAALAIAGAVVLWAARLTLHLAQRDNRSHGEDPRYRRMRETVGPSFWWRSLFTVFLLQGVLQWLIAAPVHAALLFPAEAAETALVVAGLCLFAVGLAIEWIADRQLARHRADSEIARTTLASGLWAWSRHPNYFGEAVLWFGLAIAAYGVSGALWAFAGPVLLTLVMVTVSAPLTERHLLDARPDYAAYRARTSAFVPWPQRSNRAKTVRL